MVDSDKTLIGEREDLAFELSVYLSNEDRKWGTLVAWAGGTMIGDRAIPVLLGSIIHSFEHSLRWCGKRRPGYPVISAEREWNGIYSKTFGCTNDREDPSDFWYERTIVFTNFVPSFDGTVCFLLEFDDYELLLWKSGSNSEVQSSRLKLGSYRSRVEELVNLLKLMTNPSGQAEQCGGVEPPLRR